MSNQKRGKREWKRVTLPFVKTAVCRDSKTEHGWAGEKRQTSGLRSRGITPVSPDETSFSPKRGRSPDCSLKAAWVSTPIGRIKKTRIAKAAAFPSSQERTGSGRNGQVVRAARSGREEGPGSERLTSRGGG